MFSRFTDYNTPVHLASLTRHLLDFCFPGACAVCNASCQGDVPLFFTRHISRGYNQSDLIARRLAKRCDKPLIKALTRVRATETQTNLSATQRIENMRGAFALIETKRLKDKHVVVIDDVTTTGATLQSAARALEQAHPASLCAITIAVA